MAPLKGSRLIKNRGGKRDTQTVPKTKREPAYYDAPYYAALTQFIEKHYSKLKDYALHQTRDPDEADEVLQEVCVRLYSGRPRRLKLESGPLAYIQLIMRSILHHKRINRQVMFESGRLMHTIDIVEQHGPCETDKVLYTPSASPKRVKVSTLVTMSLDDLLGQEEGITQL